MARSHGKVLVDIWIDEDWLDRSPLEQWVYLMLLSQPKTNLVGCVDYEPHRWATKATGLTVPAIEDALIGLECAGYVCIDRETSELLIRSMTKHDGLRTNNPKILKGLWGQWRGITSRMLRKIAVDNMPDALFDSDEVPQPALDMRRSDRTDWAMRQAIGDPIEGQSDARSFRPPPSTTQRPPSADTQSSLPSAGRYIDQARAELERSVTGAAQPREEGRATA